MIILLTKTSQLHIKITEARRGAAARRGPALGDGRASVRPQVRGRARI